MGRLVVPEPKQQGSRTGSWKPASKKRDRSPAAPAWKDRISRSKIAAAETPAVETPSKLSPSTQAEIALKHAELQGLPSEQKSAALSRICEEYGVGRKYPSRIAKRVKTKRKLALKQGQGAAHAKAMTKAKEEELMQILKENAYDLTFRQLEEKIGIASSIICRHFKTTPGWRQCGKSTRPLLEEKHIKGRAAWAKKHKNNKFKHHVDLDEKWFYVISNRGRLKLPPGVKKPKTRVKSKRFIAKVMVLSAIARPNETHGFSGMVGCWRITKPFVYSRKTTYRGTVYYAGDSREVDCNMDGDKFAEILTEKVFPAIRDKMSYASEVKIQYDNAGGHGMKTIESKIDSELPAPRGGGPKLTLVPQEAQSPDTNGCDLGFFNSVDSTLPKIRPYDLDKFFELIEKAHENYPAEKLDKIFDSKMRVIQAILACNPPGGNDYKMPHARD